MTSMKRPRPWSNYLIKLLLAGPAGAAAVFSVLVITSCDSGSPASGPSRYLVAAQEAGRWLDYQKQGDQEAYWYSWVEDTSVVSLSLGSGVAGIVRFYLALAEETGDSMATATARSGADWLLLRVDSLAAESSEASRAGSLYGGLPGVAVVLTEAADQLGDEGYRDGARKLTEAVHQSGRRVADGVEWSAYNDVLFGGAGTGLFLLWAAESLDHGESLQLAVAVGETLAARAVADSGGLNWSLRRDRDIVLPNFSHGAPGVGYFMLRLHEATGDSRWLEIALGAARYLESIADTTDGTFLLPYSVPNGQFNYDWDIGWAHGPAGSARFYYLLARETGDERWLSHVSGAVRALKESGLPGLPHPRFGSEPFKPDMRFGQASVAEFVIDWGAASGDSAAMDFGMQLVDDLLRQARSDTTGTWWTIPQYGFMSDPGMPASHTGYFYGAAGFGMVLLRADAALSGREWVWRLPDNPF